MTRGFVTVATGNDRYYRMARNLLHSYRDNCKEQIPFALITDKDSECAKEFDDVVILKDATCSWMDKMRILDSCPYDENIFIDADCLIYHDVNYLWGLFRDADDFSCFGKALPLNCKDWDGWFTKESIAGGYDIHFITHLHGIIYFIRKGTAIEQLQTICEDIITNYHKMTFKGFNDRLADEPVFALAMAIQNLKPIHKKPEDYCFVPFCSEVNTDYFTHSVTFCNPTEGSVRGCNIVHWGNLNTQKAQYRFEVSKIEWNYLNKRKIGCVGRMLYQHRLLYAWYVFRDWQKAKSERIKYIVRRIPEKLRGQ